MADGSVVTERLTLRPPQADDLPWLLEAMNTVAVLRHLGGEMRSPDQVAQGLADDIAAFGSGGHRRWTVWLNGSDVRVGRCGLFHVRSEVAPPELRGQNEIGWTFAEQWWGRGYATEAARAVIDHFFADPAPPVLWSQTSDSNAASTRMMVRLGLSRRAELDYVDPAYPAADNPTTIYGLTRAEWQARR